MAKIVPYTKNRQLIYDLLARAKKYHSTLTTTLDLDVTETLAALARARAAGRVLGLMPTMIKATSLTLKKYPRLNHHLFHGVLRRYEVDFEEISCNLVIMREAPSGEKVLLPVILRRSDEMTIDAIQEIVVHHQRTPLAELPQLAQMERIKKMPGPLLRLFSFKARSDHRFYLKYFGTYGFSPLLHEDERGVAETSIGVAAHSIANTGAVFFPFALRDKPVVVDGQLGVRKVLAMTLGVDHNIADGYDAVLAGLHLQKLLSRPEQLGLPAAAPASLSA